MNAIRLSTALEAVRRVDLGVVMENRTSNARRTTAPFIGDGIPADAG
jgi:hypothetical protein